MNKTMFISIFSIMFLVVLASAAFFPEPWGGNVDAGGYDLNNVGTINADSIIGALAGDINWTHLQNYPSACPGSGAVTTLGDSVTCSDLWVDVTGDVMQGSLEINSSVNDKLVFGGNQSLPHTILLKDSKGVRFFDDDAFGSIFEITNDGIVTIMNGLEVSGDVNFYTDLRIIDDSVLGSEIATQANAVSDPNGNEANAVTGWITTGGTLLPQTSNPYVGTYQMYGESGDANDHLEYDFTVEVGKTYKISFAARRGNVGTTQQVSGWVGFVTDPTISITSETWTEYETFLVADSTSAKIKVHSAKDGASGDKVHFDNFSIREVQSGDLTVSGDILVSHNLNVTENIYVQGCITYNMSGTPATLGDCI